MLMSIVKVVLWAVVLHFAIEYRLWTDWDKKLPFKNRPGPCKTVLPDGGSEDVTYIGYNIVLFSAGYGAPTGRINALNLTDDSVFEMTIIDAPNVEDFMLKPHGINVWTDPKTGQMTLFVVTHPDKGDRIEVFDIVPPLTLKHRKSITDPKFGFMNDLVAIDSERFYITQMFRYTDVNKYAVEFFLRLKLGNVIFYDGKKAREVVSGLFMANGINISPDKQVVYVAEFGFKKLLGYRRDNTNNLAKIWELGTDTGLDNIEVNATTGDLWIGCHPLMWPIVDAVTYGLLKAARPSQEMDFNTGVDNIEVEPDTGNLWIGCHPAMWTRMDVYELFHPVSPSQVLYVKMTDNMVDRIEEVYSDDGSEAIGTSSATLVNGRLVIGTVSDQILVCDTTS